MICSQEQCSIIYLSLLLLLMCSQEQCSIIYLSLLLLANSFATAYLDDGVTKTLIRGSEITEPTLTYPPRPDPLTEKGDWNATTKTFALNGNGTATRTTYREHATPVAYRTTRTVTISDSLGTRRSTTEVFTGGTAYSVLTTTDYAYDVGGRIIEVRRDGDLISSTTYHAPGTRTVTEEDGSTTTYSADVPGSNDSSQTNLGGGVFPDQVSGSTTAWNAEGTTTSYSRSAGNLALSSTSSRTHGGRILSTTDELGRITTYSSVTTPATGQRVETETGPGGVTRITTYHRDGQLKSITGTGVIPEFYEYSVSGGLLMTTVRSGTANSIRLRKTFTNGNGTLIREESPLPGGRTLSRAYSYDTQGRLTRVQRTGLADERTEYDSLGRVARRGLDVNGNGTLDPASSDRIVETAQFYEQNSGGWWEVSNSTTYLIPGNNTTTLLGSRKRRLGIGAGGLDVTTSADGQIFTISTNIDRTTGTTTVTTTANFSSQPAVSVYRYGRLIAQNSFTVANSSLYAYDALGRVTSVTDPRTGLATVITLNAVGQPLSVTRPDPDGGGPLQALVTRSGYYPATHPNAGELHWSEDGLGKRTYRAYNTRGQVTHQWGPATYPLRHLYDAFGEMTGLHTWRSGESEAWAGETLPAAFSSEAPDATTWVYDQASGRLTQKKDAAGNGPIYAWSNAGQCCEPN